MQRLSVSVLALSVTPDGVPPLPKGEAIAAHGQLLLNLGYALAPPLGELASECETERVRTLTESHYTAIGTSLGQSDAIAVPAALTLPGSPSQSSALCLMPALPEGEPLAGRASRTVRLGPISHKVPGPAA